MRPPKEVVIAVVLLDTYWTQWDSKEVVVAVVFIRFKQQLVKIEFFMTNSRLMYSMRLSLLNKKQYSQGNLVMTIVFLSNYVIKKL